MPLMHGKSKKAFSKNVEIEMNHGKPQKQALAIAYSIKRSNKRKHASGGSVQSGSKDMNYAEGGEISASNEKRPMPDNRYNDSKEASRNSGNKPPKNDQWLDQPTVEQAKANDSRRVLPIKRPKMVPSNAFSTRLYDEEGRLQESANPGPYDAQPPKHDDEEGANRQGPKVPDMEDEHSTHRKPYAKGGEIEPGDSESHNLYKRTEQEPADHEIELKERDQEADLMSMEHPSEDEGASDAHMRNEEGPDRHGPDVPDMEDEHSTGRKPYAEGGSIQYKDSMENEDHDMELNPAHGHYSEDDSESQPHEEEEEERHNSIAAAIMAKKERQLRLDSDSDIDHQMMMAEGGEILKHSNASDIKSKRSIDSDDSSQVDLSRNADEDANEEDQLSYNALRKENYSESEGLRKLDQPHDSNLKGDDEESDSENQHDMVSKIRSKMNMKRQFPK